MPEVWWDFLPHDERSSTDIVRWALSQRSGVSLDDVDVARSCLVCDGTDHGRFDPWRGWQASLSHAGEWVAVCVGRGVRVGIDIERVGRVTASLAEDIRHREDPPAPLEELWVRKEAYVKACGVGLVRPLSTVNLAQLPAGHGTFSIEAPKEYIGALAVLA